MPHSLPTEVPGGAPPAKAVLARRAGVPADGSGRMFDAIARRYDLLNRILSLGLDHGWRRQAVRALALAPDARVLDLATGTGDVALELLGQAERARVVGVDPSVRMLELARRKGRRAGVARRLALQEGRAEELPFRNGSFDAVTMAFGIRNVPDRPRALREIARVLRRGGRVALLELSEPRRGILGLPARLYVRHVVPNLGALLSSSREYRYLERSIAVFPPPAEFARTMVACGFETPVIRSLAFGAAHLFVAAVAEAEA